jgi:hypothetical protein
MKKRKTNVLLVESLLQRHFGKQKLHALVTASRTFPITARVALQSALENLFAEYSGSQVVLEEMLFSGGSLNVKLLGGAAPTN